MTLYEAIEFLSPCRLDAGHPTVWTDLGCGSGLFTHALVASLAPASRVYAVDKQLNFVQRKEKNVSIDTVQADFVDDELPFTAVNGVLMANALHYVKDKEAFIRKMATYLQQDGMWIIIEYDTKKANPWIPYPVDFESLRQLFRKEGYKQVVKRSERKSIYNPANMYCATVR